LTKTALLGVKKLLEPFPYLMLGVVTFTIFVFTALTRVGFVVLIIVVVSS